MGAQPANNRAHSFGPKLPPAAFNPGANPVEQPGLVILAGDEVRGARSEAGHRKPDLMVVLPPVAYAGTPNVPGPRPHGAPAIDAPALLRTIAPPATGAEHASSRRDDD